MIPTRFTQSNILFQPPTGMKDCKPVHGCLTKDSNNNPIAITAWRPKPEELVRINLGEPVYLILWGSSPQPAMLLGGISPWELTEEEAAKD